MLIPPCAAGRPPATLCYIGPWLSGGTERTSFYEGCFSRYPPEAAGRYFATSVCVVRPTAGEHPVSVPILSAGILVHRLRDGVTEVLLGHPGGPFWARRDDGAWTIPKGEYDGDEDPWDAARREFAEELGRPVPSGPRIELGSLRQPSGKVLTVFAVHSDFDVTGAVSNTFSLEWPKGSGQFREFPELDRVAWLPLAMARPKLVKGQREFLDRLAAQIC